MGPNTGFIGLLCYPESTGVTETSTAVYNIRKPTDFVILNTYMKKSLVILSL